MHKNKKASAEIICPILQPCLQASLQAPMSACSAVIIAFSYRYMPLARDGGSGKAGGGGRTHPHILADKETSAAASPARRITTRHPRFSDLPPSLLAHHIVYSHLNCLLTCHARWLLLFLFTFCSSKAKNVGLCTLYLDENCNVFICNIYQVQNYRVPPKVLLS